MKARIYAGTMLALGLLLCAMVAPSFYPVKLSPRLVLSFQGISKFEGNVIAMFTVTNHGAVTAIEYGTIGKLEFEATPGGALPVRCARGQHHLPAGSGDFIAVYLPKVPRGRWRIHCLYGRESISSKLNDWQRSRDGPYAEMKRFTAPFLRGVPLDMID